MINLRMVGLRHPNAEQRGDGHASHYSVRELLTCRHPVLAIVSQSLVESSSGGEAVGERVGVPSGMLTKGNGWAGCKGGHEEGRTVDGGEEVRECEERAEEKATGLYSLGRQ